MNKQTIAAAVAMAVFGAAQSEPSDPIRAKACDEFVEANSYRTNRYTHQKEIRYRWVATYKYQGMWKRPEFGPHYLLRYDITPVGASEGLQYYCVSDIKTKKPIALELDPVN